MHHPPPELAAHLATVYRRMADLLDHHVGEATEVEVVVHDTADLDDPEVRWAVEEIARHGHRVGVRLTIRGRGPASAFTLGGSVVLVAAMRAGHATYRQVSTGVVVR